jgi:hypothetical protein
MPSDHILTGRLRRAGRLAALGPRAAWAAARDAVHARSGDPESELLSSALGETLYGTLGDLKAASLKVGQILAQVAGGLTTQPEVDALEGGAGDQRDRDAAGARAVIGFISPRTAAGLGRLFSEAPALPFDQVAGIVREELGAEPAACFARFEEIPFAGASLGQVHRAELQDGTRVAVKVQYPGVADALAHDLDLLGGVANTATGGGLLFDASAYFQTLRALTLSELDYRAEADRLDRVADAVRRWSDLVVPSVHRELSTGRVLVTELLEGPTLHVRFDHVESTEERLLLGAQLLRAVLGPLFVAGVVNADAHPGNFVVLDGGRLGLLDFGAVTSVGPERVEGLARLVSELMGETGFNPWGASTREANAFVGLLDAAGFEIHLRPVRAAAFAMDFARIVAPPFRGSFDFGRSPVLAKIGRFKQERPLDFFAFRPGPDLLPIMRALLGLQHGLRRLGLRTDLRPTLRDLLAAHQGQFAAQGASTT